MGEFEEAFEGMASPVKLKVRGEKHAALERSKTL
jgi:hypothetical protein